MTFLARGTELCGLCASNAVTVAYANSPEARRWYRAWAARLHGLEWAD
jgi:hypothetical protein